MKRKILSFLVLLNLAACAQKNIPNSSDFELFKDSKSWPLAKAVANDDKSKIQQILSKKEVNINFREPYFGQTLLHLAIKNDKLLSTSILLENHANVNILNSDREAAIHVVTQDVKGRNNSYEILKLLIKNGANVNDTCINPNINDTIGFYTPLMGAVDDLKCAKLLLENGANPYIKTGTTYLVWLNALLFESSDNIFVAEYMIVQKKMPIPNPITYNVNKEPIAIFSLLNHLKFSNDPDKEKVRIRILDYLHGIEFPKNNTYSDSK